jgi:uncharacterized protein YbcI
MDAEVTPGGRGAEVDHDARRSQLAQTSRTMVRLYKELFGRGPVRVWSEWAGNDTLVCTLEDTLTTSERRLRDMGEHQRLRDMRTFFQYSALREFIEPIEGLTGRKVRSFVSGIDVHTDVAVEMFLFYPRGSDGASRTALGEG